MMSLESFARGMKLLSSRFGKKPNQDLMDVYYSRLKRIPDEAWNDIVEAIIDDEKFFPTPGLLKRLWYDWWQSKPEKRLQRKYLPCKHCDGRGFLEFIAFIEKLGRKYKKICRCGHCENWREATIPSHYPLWTVYTIQERGFELTGSSVASLPIGSLKSVKECVDMVTDDVPF